MLDRSESIREWRRAENCKKGDDFAFVRAAAQNFVNKAEREMERGFEEGYVLRWELVETRGTERHAELLAEPQILVRVSLIEEGSGCEVARAPYQFCVRENGVFIRDYYRNEFVGASSDYVPERIVANVFERWRMNERS